MSTTELNTNRINGDNPINESSRIDEDKLNEVLGKAVVDAGATMQAGLVVIGDKLGLYKAMAGAGPLTTSELARKTETVERYCREWLRANAASGYVGYDPETDTYELTPEQAMLFADDDSPAFLAGGFQMAVATLLAVPRIQQAFKTGGGLGWHEHDDDVFHGVERVFRPSYLTYLASEWIPSLDGVEAKLQDGGKIADIGCGHGASTILLARTYPNAEVVGFDFHEASIEQARRRAAEAGVADRVRFETQAAKEFNGAGYDLVTTFDCLHDMGDPAGAARHIREMLKDDGTWMIVEPFASDRVQDNLNPVGRLYYSVSTLVCTPSSLSQEVGRGLGAQAGEAQVCGEVAKGGFTRFRRVAETPFNLVYEARK